MASSTANEKHKYVEVGEPQAHRAIAHHDDDDDDDHRQPAARCDHGSSCIGGSSSGHATASSSSTSAVLPASSPHTTATTNSSPQQHHPYHTTANFDGEDDEDDHLLDIVGHSTEGEQRQLAFSVSDDDDLDDLIVDHEALVQHASSDGAHIDTCSSTSFCKLVAAAVAKQPPPQTSSKHYRPDIDGLRAVAILAVVLYHWNSGTVPGGYTGVDIFFVISGFLITSNIRRNMNKDTFSIKQFYRRRVQRIFPALCVLLLFAALIIPFYFGGPLLYHFYDSIPWSLVSAANLFFYRKMPHSYFEEEAKEVPLLHLWSLGVEEQFYMIWPLLLWLLPRERQGRRLSFWKHKVWVLALSFLSILSGDWELENDDRGVMFAYYLLPCRLGELGLGGFVALELPLWVDTIRSDPKLAKALSYTGVFFLFVSLFVFSDETAFPGMDALPPVLGACCLIASGCSDAPFTTRWLSEPIAVFFGLVSYSAYLYHWPIMATLRFRNYDVDGALGFHVVMVTFVLAWLSYRFVEVPTRALQNLTDKQVFKWFGYVPIAVILFIVYSQRGLWDVYEWEWSRGHGSHTSAMDLIVKDYPDLHRPLYDSQCAIGAHVMNVALLSQPCLFGSNGEKEASAFLFGDSNARHFTGLFEVFGEASDFSVVVSSHEGCIPWIPGSEDEKDAYMNAKFGFSAGCKLYQEVALQWSLKFFDVTIWAQAWSFYERYLTREYQNEHCKLLEYLRNVVAPKFSALPRGSKTLILVGEVPHMVGFRDFCLSTGGVAMKYCLQHYPKVVVDTHQCNSELEAIARKHTNVYYWDASKVLCHGGLCSPWPGAQANSTGEELRGSLPFYENSYHLSPVGARQLGHVHLDTFGLPPVFEKLKAAKKTALLEHAKTVSLSDVISSNYALVP